MSGYAKSRELDALLARDRELDTLFERLYEDNVSGKIDDEQEQEVKTPFAAGMKKELDPAAGKKRMDVDDFWKRYAVIRTPPKSPSAW